MSDLNSNPQDQKRKDRARLKLEIHHTHPAPSQTAADFSVPLMEILLERITRTLNNVLRADELADSVEKYKAYIEALGESHQTELLNLRSVYAANLARRDQVPIEKES